MNEWNKVSSVVKLFGVLASIFVIALTVYTFKAMGYIGSAPANNSISVSGHGEAFAVPDIATVSFSVEKTAKTVAEAQNQVTTTMNDILAALKAQGIAEKDIKTISYDINQKYEYQNSICTAGLCPPSRQILVGYTVNNTVSVKIRKIDAAGEVIGLLGQKAVTNLSGLSLTVEDDSAVKNEARNEAIAEARARAESIAKSLGVRLVRVSSFQESTGGMQPMFYSAKDMRETANQAGSAPTPSIPVGENKASSDVTITYEIL